MRTRTRELPPLALGGGSAIVMDYGNFDAYLKSMGEPYIPVLATMNTGTPVNNGPQGSSSITDEENGWGGTNFCRHVKETYSANPYDVITKYGGSTWCWERARRATPVSLVGFTHPLLSLPSYGMTPEAWHGMQPEIDSGLSLTNTIIEMKDFKSLSRFIVGGSKSLAALATKVTRQGKTKTLAEISLANNLALQPTCSDFANISLKLPNFKAALKRFDARGARPSKRGYRLVFGETTSDPYGNFDGFLYQKETRGTYVVGGLCTYRRHSLGSLDDLLQYAGLTLTPAQVWDALPFSFLLDYVYNVGSVLDRLSRSESISVDWTQLCASVKTEVTVTKFLPLSAEVRYFRGGEGGPTSFGYPIASTKSTIYERFPTNPPVWADLSTNLPDWKTPTDKQLGNALALLRTSFGK